MKRRVVWIRCWLCELAAPHLRTHADLGDPDAFLRRHGWRHVQRDEWLCRGCDACTRPPKRPGLVRAQARDARP